MRGGAGERREWGIFLWAEILLGLWSGLSIATLIVPFGACCCVDCKTPIPTSSVLYAIRRYFPDSLQLASLRSPIRDDNDRLPTLQVMTPDKDTFAPSVEQGMVTAILY